jgi:hypothetical protein
MVLGDEHRRLRGALNVGFTASAVRNYQPLFKAAAEMVRISNNLSLLIQSCLCPQISEHLEKSAATSTDVCPLLSTATLSAVSQGGRRSTRRFSHSITFSGVLGCSIEDFGEDFVKNSFQVM